MSKPDLASLYSTNNKMKRIIEFRCKSLSAECIKDAYNNKPIKSIGCQNTGQGNSWKQAPNGCPCKGPTKTQDSANLGFISGCVVGYGGISRTEAQATCVCKLSNPTCLWNYKYRTNGKILTAISKWNNVAFSKVGDNCSEWFNSVNCVSNCNQYVTNLLPCDDASEVPTSYPQFTAQCATYQE
jgi:hypothetical protein